MGNTYSGKGTPLLPRRSINARARARDTGLNKLLKQSFGKVKTSEDTFSLNLVSVMET